MAKVKFVKERSTGNIRVYKQGTLYGYLVYTGSLWWYYDPIDILHDSVLLVAIAAKINELNH